MVMKMEDVEDEDMSEVEEVDGTDRKKVFPHLEEISSLTDCEYAQFIIMYLLNDDCINAKILMKRFVATSQAEGEEKSSFLESLEDIVMAVSQLSATKFIRLAKICEALCPEECMGVFKELKQKLHVDVLSMINQTYSSIHVTKVASFFDLATPDQVMGFVEKEANWQMDAMNSSFVNIADSAIICEGKSSNGSSFEDKMRTISRYISFLEC